MPYDLVVVGFHSKELAGEALNELLQLSSEGAIDLFDAVAAHRTPDGKLRIDDSVQTTPREAAGWGAIFGALLGALIVGPLTGGFGLAASLAVTGLGAAAAGTVSASVGADHVIAAKESSGLSQAFLRDVAEMIQSADSAVFVLFKSRSAQTVVDTLRRLGGTPLHAAVSGETVERARNALRE